MCHCRVGPHLALSCCEGDLGMREDFVKAAQAIKLVNQQLDTVEKLIRKMKRDYAKKRKSATNH
jgi:hypothetical protein